MRIFLFLSLCLSLATALRAEVIDLSEHTSLKGAYLVPVPNAEFVRVQLLLDVGEADFEGPEGLAHYLEHLVWYSVDRQQGRGPKERIANAWTNTFLTNYWNVSDPSKLDDLIAAAGLVFAPIKLDRSFARQERDIVEREFEFSMVDDVGRRLYDHMIKALVPGHALSRSTIGSRESLQMIGQDMAAVFKDKWYLPQSATLLVTGPVREADLVPLLTRHLNTPSDKAAPQRPWRNPIAWDGREVSVSMTHPKVREPFFSILITAPKPSHMSLAETDHALKVLRELLDGSTKSSPRKALYFDDFILSEVDVVAWHNRAETMMLLITGTPDEDISMQEAMATTRAFLRDFGSLPLDEFEQVQTAILEPRERRKDAPRFIQNTAFDGLVASGRPYSVEDYLAGLQSVTPSDVDTLMRAFQQNGILVSGVAEPKETQ